MSSIDYHLKEAEIQRKHTHPRHVRPVVPPQVKRILDVGCGIGQTLATASLPPGTFACGIDIDEEALRYGAQTERWIHFVQASAERLPFADKSFDMVIARVSLPWMHIPTAMREISRVLDHHGHLWISLVGLSTSLADLGTAIRVLNVRNAAFRLYVLANGLLFHMTGRQFRFPLRRRRCESYQTNLAMTRLLRSLGFESIRIDRTKLFILTAERT